MKILMILIREPLKISSVLPTANAFSLKTKLQFMMAGTGNLFMLIICRCPRYSLANNLWIEPCLIALRTCALSLMLRQIFFQTSITRFVCRVAFMCWHLVLSLQNRWQKSGWPSTFIGPRIHSAHNAFLNGHEKYGLESNVARNSYRVVILVLSGLAILAARLCGS